MKNIKYSILLLVLLLVGCSSNSNASEQKYVLCYTKNKSNLIDDSFVAGYSEKGKVVFEDEINGVFYYNIMKNKDKYVIDNGEVRNEYDIEGNNEETKYDKNKGNLAAHSYIYYKNKLVYIYNYGINTEVTDKYISYISYENKDLLIEGRILSFTNSDNVLYLLCTTSDVFDEDTVNLVSVNLDEMKIEKTTKLDNVKTSQESDISGLDRFNDNNYIYFEELLDDGDENSNDEISICRLSLSNNTIEKKKLINEKFSNNFYVFCMFKLDGKNYLIANDSKIYEFNFNDNNLFTEVDIETPKGIAYPYNIYVKDDMVYILCGDEKLMVYELDLKNKKFSKSVILESNSKYDDFALSGFLVLD